MKEHVEKIQNLCLSTQTTPQSVFTIVVLFLLIETINSQGFMPIFLAEPKNLTANNGTSNITFRCAIGYNTDESGVHIMWFQGSTPIFLDNADLLPDGQPYRKVIKMSNEYLTNLAKNLSQEFKNLQGFTLVLSSLQTSDDDVFKCQVIPGNVIKSAKLTVFVPPEKPIMTLTPEPSEWQDGQPVKFTCSSSRANPFSSVFIKWLLNAEELFQSPQSGINITSTPQITKFGDFASELSLILTRDFFNKTVYCIVNYRDPLEQELLNMTSGRQLTFKYGPYITINITSPAASVTFPSASSSLMSLNYFIIKVLENTTLFMRCISDSYPPTDRSNQITWMKDGRTEANSASPTINVTVNSRNVTYTCQADNGSKKSQANVTFDVLYAPKLTLPLGVENNTIRIIEGLQFNFSFSVDANPFPSQLDFVWYRNGSRFRSGEILQISSITRSDSSVYSLNVTSKLEPFDSNSTVFSDQKSIRVVVNYSPGKATLTANKKMVYQGGEVILRCSIEELDPDLEETVIWELNSIEINSSSQFLFSSRTLRLLNVTSTVGGNYTCRGRNNAGLGTISESLEVQIIEIPKLISFTPTNSLMEISIGDKLPVMTCVVSGKSKPKLSWTKNGKQPDDVLFNITNRDVQNPGNDTDYMVASTLEMTSGTVTASTSGNYSCIATTFLGDDFLLRSIDILVKHPPEFTNKPVNQTYDINGSAYLSCRYSGYPAPSVSWMKSGTKINPEIVTASQDKYQIKSFDVSRFIYEIQLVIGGLLESDGGEYDCTVENYLGAANQSSFLTIRTRPKMISSVSLGKQTWESIQLNWQPGQDGGYVQTFRIFIRTSSNGQISNPQFTTSTNSVNMTGLMPNTSYLVNIEAYNQLGSSEKSKDFEVATSVLIMPTTHGVNYVARSMTIYSLNVPPQPEYLCLLIRPTSRPQTGNWTCIPVSSGQTDLSVNLGSNLQQPWEAGFCLFKRPEICGIFSPLDIDTQPIGVQGIIAMAVLLPLLLIALLVALALSIYFCWKKYSKEPDDKKKHSSNQTDIASIHEYSLKPHSESSGSINSEKVDLDNDASELSKWASSSDGSKGYINKMFYCDLPNSDSPSDSPVSGDVVTLDIKDGEHFVMSKKKVYHEVIV